MAFDEVSLCMPMQCVASRRVELDTVHGGHAVMHGAVLASPTCRIKFTTDIQAHLKQGCLRMFMDICNFTLQVATFHYATASATCSALPPFASLFWSAQPHLLNPEYLPRSHSHIRKKKGSHAPMNSSRPFASARNTFAPAFQYLSQITSSNTRSKPSTFPSHHRRASSISIDGIDLEASAYTDEELDENFGPAMPHSARTSASSNELAPSAIPLIDFSRSSSPYPRSRSAVQSEDEDDDYEFERESSIRPLVSQSRGGSQRGWKSILKPGGLGQFFFGTWAGWQVYVGILVFWVGGCSFGLLLMNRFILLTGVYKIRYPLAATYIQLIITHILLVVSASLTRALAGPLRRIGLGGIAAPGLPALSNNPSYRSGKSSFAYRWLIGGSGGIAGGGLFEFERAAAMHVLPLAAIYVGKVMLSNISFTPMINSYTELPVYQMSRIGIVPLSLMFTSVLTRESHSVPTLSAALTATINLFVASLKKDAKRPWEGVVPGVFSAFFVALYPIFLLRTYRLLVADLVPQGDILTGFPASSGDETPSSREETRAYWRTLHYTSLLSIFIMTPILFLSGEISEMMMNCYVCDVPFLWLLILCGGIGSWAVFATTLLLAKATSPLTVTFLSIPRSAFQLTMLEGKMPVHSWVGILICWLSCLWYLFTKRGEGRQLDRLRLEGRS
ncbi:hypothetical protein EJ05DRAFT_483973 [Pseudovirgaria hyperparasitica]|uniref:GDP-mannose transporter n=1 Tax=Pseudovirgaria hyperparasitica TaxID=470096 RepID=A0A6A6WCA4_9PEZI|nr:uncharacterized protein EJ05DRAFT_483973 [Pseudovirgaria hyperparasitica]KAF2760205.1 hypothetical protein EJ05DRAFT_483973 [Pseudovirgaria hyperparasitica]